jgi:hypothetical protein
LMKCEISWFLINYLLRYPWASVVIARDKDTVLKVAGMWIRSLLTSPHLGGRGAER